MFSSLPGSDTICVVAVKICFPHFQFTVHPCFYASAYWYLHLSSVLSVCRSPCNRTVLLLGWLPVSKTPLEGHSLTQEPGTQEPGVLARTWVLWERWDDYWPWRESSEVDTQPWLLILFWLRSPPRLGRSHSRLKMQTHLLHLPGLRSQRLSSNCDLHLAIIYS